MGSSSSWAHSTFMHASMPAFNHRLPQVRRELHGYSGEMEMEQYMGGRLMGGSSSINGEQVGGWVGQERASV